MRDKLSAKYLEMIRELNTIHFMLRDQAIQLRDAFFADAKREGKILYRTVQMAYGADLVTKGLVRAPELQRQQPLAS